MPKTSGRRCREEGVGCDSSGRCSCGWVGSAGRSIPTNPDEPACGSGCRTRLGPGSSIGGEVNLHPRMRLEPGFAGCAADPANRPGRFRQSDAGCGSFGRGVTGPSGDSCTRDATGDQQQGMCTPAEPGGTDDDAAIVAVPAGHPGAERWEITPGTGVPGDPRSA